MLDFWSDKDPTNDAGPELTPDLHKQLGADAWLRATHNAPDEWEEEDFVGAISKALSDPARAPEVWLLAKPTKYECALLALGAR